MQYRVFVPKIAGGQERRNLVIGPPGLFVALTVQILMVLTAQRYGKFIADLASKRSGLREFEMVGIAGRALTDEAGLRCDKHEMRLVTLPDGLSERRDHFRCS